MGKPCDVISSHVSHGFLILSLHGYAKQSLLAKDRMGAPFVLKKGRHLLKRIKFYVKNGSFMT